MMFSRAPRFVASANGVQVAVYDEPPTHGGGAPILFSHATGFHGRVFAPIAAHLAEHSRTTFDYRG